ncbi:hypothetical protein AVEN_94158-1 [Araneus ventricosus]|uniref:Uncharacterized protein n=1 Tax=Araneus ventricosus TaxID=182803 RepID=A0A4Y2N779_ARAVE|nr:hypothetical protein AVEN_94158-1 [Araneus ventricosus]
MREHERAKTKQEIDKTNLSQTPSQGQSDVILPLATRDCYQYACAWRSVLKRMLNNNRRSIRDGFSSFGSLLDNEDNTCVVTPSLNYPATLEKGYLTLKVRFKVHKVFMQGGSLVESGFKSETLCPKKEALPPSHPTLTTSPPCPYHQAFVALPPAHRALTTRPPLPYHQATVALPPGHRALNA